MPLFRKRQIVVEAIRFDGSNADEISRWAAAYGCKVFYQEGFTRDLLAIRTLNGRVFAESGEWIIRGIKDEFYPCKNDIFEATYEPASPDP